MNEITRTFLQPNKKEITVYKIFNKSKNGDYFSLFQQPTIDCIGKYFKFPPIGEWISCYIDINNERWPNRKIKPFGNNVVYSCGFHSYMDMDYEQICTISENLLFYDRKYNIVLCECRAKFRLYYGIIDCSINGNNISSEICVSRGIKILKELEV